MATKRSRPAARTATKQQTSATSTRSTRAKANATNTSPAAGATTTSQDGSVGEPSETRDDVAPSSVILRSQSSSNATPVGTPRTRRSLGQKTARASVGPQHAAPPSAQQLRTRIESTPMAGDTSVAALAHFRRRPRQPSLLHMIQNPDDGWDSSELNLDTTLGPEDSPVFAPHDESTPQPAARPAIAAPVFQTTFDDDELYAVSPRAKQGRKRKSDEISRLDADESIIEVPRSQTPSRLPHSSSSLSEALSSPTLPAASDDSSTPRRIDLDPEVFADPLSSSATSSPTKSPVKRSTTKGSKPPAPTTAMLRALLPRRQQRRTTHDSDSDSNSEPDTPPARRGTRKPLAEVKRRNAPLGSKPRRGIAAGKENTTARQKGKTYARRSQVAEVEESSSEHESSTDDARLSKELQAARDKFRAIDQAELEFESASLGGSGSSPWR